MKILKPKNFKTNTAFRELIDIWCENKYCIVEDSPDIFCWANSHGDILLYDYDTLKQLNRHINLNFRLGLFANTVSNNTLCKSWIYFPKFPKLVNQIRQTALPNYENRNIQSIFLGGIENKTQEKNRNIEYWNKSNLEVFSCVRNRKYLYSNIEYLKKLKYSKFGLCLPGFGPKCNRDIELIAMGTIPIFTPGVDNTYYEPLVEDVHFLYASSPEQVEEKIKSTSREKWIEMHNEGQNWYDRNISNEGSFLITQKIINKKN